MVSDLYIAILDSITGLIHPDVASAFPDVPIVINNSPFDRDNAPALWAEVDIEFMTASQIGMSWKPRSRQRGVAYVCVYAREGTGVRASVELLGWFADRLGYARRGSVQLKTPEMMSESSIKGWSLKALKVEFFADEV